MLGHFILKKKIKYSASEKLKYILKLYKNTLIYSKLIIFHD